MPRGAIFAVNHTSELDCIVVPAALPFFCHLMPMFYTSREKQFYKLSGWRQMFYGGLFFKLWGAHPVAVGLHNYETSLTTHINIIRHGGSLIIFPEGKRSRDGVMQKGKGGVTYMAYATGKPIIPVAIAGNFGLHPSDFFLRKPRISVMFGKPISAQSLFGTAPVSIAEGHDPFIDASQRVMQAISNLMPAHSITVTPDLLPAKREVLDVVAKI